ncbi:unnamed protein product [Hymenolepis diminuta]|uniref:Integrase catalytic domain-containing protein n=1 Tax=Hymenolepis diminuta TaxID=6216 RepID=A0A564YE36_HYMDI|nr:unnamed protein product [Hymenolepis diminuta]
MPKQQPVPTFCLLGGQTYHICLLEGHEEGYHTFASSRTTKIKSPRCLGQCNHIQAKSILVCSPEQSALVDDECKNVVAQSVDEAEQTAAHISSKDPFMYSQAKVLWSHTDFTLDGPIQGNSHLILVDSYSKWPEIIPIKSTTTGAIINNLLQKCHPVLFYTRVEAFCRGLNIPLLNSPPTPNGPGELVGNVKGQHLVSQGKEKVELPDSALCWCSNLVRQSKHLCSQ